MSVVIFIELPRVNRNFLWLGDVKVKNSQSLLLHQEIYHALIWAKFDDLLFQLLFFLANLLLQSVFLFLCFNHLFLYLFSTI